MKNKFEIGVSRGIQKGMDRKKVCLIIVAILMIITAIIEIPRIIDYEYYYVNTTSLAVYFAIPLVIEAVLLIILLVRYFYDRKMLINVPNEISISETQLNINGTVDYSLNANEIKSVTMTVPDKSRQRKLSVVTADGNNISFSLGYGKSLIIEKVFYDYSKIYQSFNEWCDSNSISFN